MAQPFNYTIQAPSAFESLISGLRLGTSLEEMRLQQEQRAAQMEQARQKALQERQQQMRLQEIYGKVNAGNATRGDWIELGDLSGSEATRKGVWETIGKMDEDAVNARVGMTQQFGFGLLKNAELTKKLMDDYLAANQNDSEIKRIRKLADMDAQFAGNALLAALPRMGKQGMDAYGKIVDRLFPVADPPKESWEPVPKAQLAAWGWRPDTQAQRDKVTGKIQGVGPGGTTVNLQSVGPPPKDYRYNYDDAGRVVSMELIAGSETERNLREQAAKEESKADVKQQTSAIVKRDVGRALDLLDKEEQASGAGKLSPYTAVTGVQGQVWGEFPGGAAVNFDLALDSVKASIGFDRLQRMREDSSTGGALGQVAVRELDYLIATLGSMNRRMDRKYLRENLRGIADIYERFAERAAKAPAEWRARHGFGGSQDAALAGGSQQPAAPAAGGRDLGGGFRALD